MSSQSYASSILSKIPMGGPGSRRQKVFEYIKTKRDEYLGGGDQDDDGFERSNEDDFVPLNDPFPNENLVLYPSYTCVKDNEYHVEVRGWLYLKAALNRRSRIVYNVAKQYAGLDSSDSESIVTTESDDSSSMRDFQPTPMSKSSTSTSISSVSSEAKEAVFQQRVAPFFYKSAPNRRVFIQIGPARSSGGSASIDTFEAVTNASGRFAARCILRYEPSLVHVEASRDVSATEEALVIKDYGISVITDIDDTIRRTGINGDRRELVRNVFVRDFNSVEVDGVVEWYKMLASQGCKFHYVSNAPWALYSTASDYIRDRGFPAGSVHLKRYNGVFSGLFEPGPEKKRNNLFAILRDFPDRKFVLVGDSGEHDLEAYVDLAVEFPNQILAIYIRDVTLPLADPDNDLSAAQYVLRPDEIDSYSTDRSMTSRRRDVLWRGQSSNNIADQTVTAKPIKVATVVAPPPPPPRKSANSTPVNPPSEPPSEPPSLIDLGDEDKPKRKPVVPRKPVNLKPSSPSGGGLLHHHHHRAQPPSKPTPTAPKTHDVPPPTPPRPSSRQQPATPTPAPSNGLTETETPPPLPKRPGSSSTRATPSPYSGIAPSSTSSLRKTASLTEDIPDEQTIDYNYRIEEWKLRIAAAREKIPGKTRLRMWRCGKDIEEESLLVVQSEIQKSGGQPPKPTSSHAREGILI